MCNRYMPTRIYDCKSYGRTIDNLPSQLYSSGFNCLTDEQALIFENYLNSINGSHCCCHCCPCCCHCCPCEHNDDDCTFWIILVIILLIILFFGEFSLDTAE